MTIAIATEMPHPRLRTAGALIVGFLAVAVLSSAADAILHALDYYPNDGSVGSDAQLALALFYRTCFTVLGGFLCAWLAPSRPLRLATILGAVGTIFAVLGVVAMWNLGHHWYAVTLALLAIPSTMLGGWLFTRLAH